MIIAGRQCMMGGKRLSAKSYIQDGLIAMWDGIENAGWGTHDANATVWTDLVGTRDLPLMDGTTWRPNGSYKNTAGPHACLLGSNNFIPNDSTKTIEIVFAWDGVYNDTRNVAVLFATSPSVGYLDGRCICISNSTPLLIVTQGVTSPAFSFSDYISERVSLSYINDGTPTGFVSARLNGISPQLTTTTRKESDVGLFLGGRVWNEGTPFYGMMGTLNCTRLYNRALTEEEIAHNYAVDKERFGL